MPVKFQGHPLSEYQMKYLKDVENLSPLLLAQKDAIHSKPKGFAVEPALQRKKRVSDVRKTDPIAFRDTDSVIDDGYMLLGNQQKFANNVKYRSRSVERPHRKKHQHPKPYVQEVKSTAVNGKSDTPPKAPRREKSLPPPPRREKSVPPPAPPRPVFDTGAPKFHKAKLSTPKPEELNAAGRPSRRREKSQKLDRKNETEYRENRRKYPSKENERKIVPKDKARKDDVHKKVVHGGKKDMNEVAQTNVAKGVADSSQEAPPNYAMKYKAGVAPPRTKGPKRLSEYAMQFTWKKGVSASPLLDAEQIVYKNNPAVPPQSSAMMPRSSEYRAAFKPWQLIKSTPNLAEKFADDQASEITPAKKIKLKRSRSVEDISELPAAGTEAIIQDTDKRLVQESLNPQRLHFPHGKLRRYRSEYDNNFKAPQKFVYTEGAWRGAAPPHVVPSKEAVTPEESNEPTNWFDEVVELRHKAEEYKRRALGTHFSRSHVGQLFADQAELWDGTSNRSTLSALDLHEPGSSTCGTERSTLRMAAGASARSPEASSVRSSRASSVNNDAVYNAIYNNDEDYDDDEETPRPQQKKVHASQKNHSRNTSNKRTQKQSFQARQDPKKRDFSTQVMSPRRESVASTLTNHSVDDDYDAEDGRIPTPQLRKSSRHHLDRTTPTVGGSMLTSPPPATKKRSAKYETIAGQVQSDPVIAQTAGRRSKEVNSDHSSDRVGRAASAPFVATQPTRGVTPPTFGLPTRDTHQLLDELASTDRPLHTNFVHSSVDARKSGKSGERMNPIHENMTATVGKPGVPRDAWMSASSPMPDDDAMSVASSCSMASEVLERARKRRDEFWRSK